MDPMRYLKTTVLPMILIGVLWGGDTQAQQPEVSFLDRETRTPRNSVHIEHNGYLWSANTLFHDGWQADGGEAAVFGNGLRFAYRPVMYISDIFRLRVGLRVLDELVYGSKPAFSTSTVSASADDADVPVDQSAANQLLRDYFLVRYLVGDWEPFPGIRLSMGRMPMSYGLGMFDNDGLCLDCGTNNNRDGVEVSANLFGMGLSVGWHWISEGPSSQRNATSLGQPLDLGQADDGGAWYWELAPEWLSPLQERKREEKARTEGSWLFDWSVRIRRRTAQLQTDRPPEGAVCADTYLGNQPDTSYDCLALVPRHSDIWSPGVFLQLRTWPRTGHSLRLSAELMASLGTIEVTQAFDEPATDRAVVAYGGAFEAIYQIRQWTFGLKAGLASGDPEGSFLGVRDGSNTVATPDSTYFLNEAYGANGTFEQFQFSPDYFIDLLLFREVIGAVTNTTYVRPSITRAFGRSEHQFSVELSAVSAWAMAAGATPGKAGYYGSEVDLLNAYRFRDLLLIELKGGLLFPGSALSSGSNAPVPGPTWTTQIDFFLMF